MSHPVERVIIGDDADGRPAFFTRSGDQVIFLGANYVVKGPPYFPPAEQVERDAAAIAAGAKASAYVPSAVDGHHPRRVLPCVRLGCRRALGAPFV